MLPAQVLTIEASRPSTTQKPETPRRDIKGLAFKALHAIKAELLVAFRGDQLQLVSNRDLVLHFEFCFAGAGIVVHDIGNELRPGRLGCALAVILQFLRFMAFKETIGISTLGKIFQFRHQARVKRPAGNRIIDGAPVYLCTAGRIVIRLGPALDLQAIDTNLGQAVDMLNCP